MFKRHKLKKITSVWGLSETPAVKQGYSKHNAFLYSLTDVRHIVNEGNIAHVT